LATGIRHGDRVNVGVYQWLRRPLLFDRSIERCGFQREKRGKIVSIVYILYIVSIPYARERGVFRLVSNLRSDGKRYYSNLVII